MSLLFTVIGVVVGLTVGIVGGLRAGEMVRGRPRAYWALNAVAVIVSMLLDFTGLATGQLWLALGAVGLMGGSITGLKYGYSESIGIWRTIDTWTGADAGLRPQEDDEDEAADRG